MASIQTITIPTKGANSSSANSSSTVTQTKHFDAFSYYSNDSVRMKRLLMKEDNETVVADSRRAISAARPSIGIDASSERSRGTDAKPNEEGNTSRKTRISFEVHPSLLLDDLLDDTLYPKEMVDVSLGDFDDLLLNLLLSGQKQQVSGKESSNLRKQ